MAKIRSDFSIIRGDTASIHFDSSENGTPIDLTGGTVFFTAKAALDNAANDAAAAIEVDVTVFSDPTSGSCDIPLSATDTDVTPGDYFYDIQVKKASGAIISIKPRKFTILADVTRRTT